MKKSNEPPKISSGAQSAVRQSDSAMLDMNDMDPYGDAMME
jgi:hypothetical protein